MLHNLQSLTIALSIFSWVELHSLSAQDGKQEMRIERLAWLAGSWGSSQDARETEEHWMSPKGGLMLGMNRTIDKARKTSFEYLRIEQRSTAAGKRTIWYVASPSGNAPTEFKLTKLENEEVVFENLTHDFPQYVIYSRNGDALTARIEGEIAGEKKVVQWNWKKLP